MQVANLYGLGFIECANEIRRYLDSIDGSTGVDRDVHSRLAGHLTKCVQQVELATYDQPDLAGIPQLVEFVPPVNRANFFGSVRGVELAAPWDQISPTTACVQSDEILSRDESFPPQVSLRFDTDRNNNNITIDVSNNYSMSYMYMQLGDIIFTIGESVKCYYFSFKTNL